MRFDRLTAKQNPIAGGTPSRKAPTVPPAYRPGQSVIAQPRMTSAGPAQTRPHTPPAYRPQPARVGQPRLLPSPVKTAGRILQAYYDMVGFVETGVATGYSGETKSFSTKTMQLPEYRIADTTRLFYSATKRQHLDSISKAGLKTDYGGSGSGSVSAPTNVGQYNSRGYIYFFNSESNAKKYGANNVDGDFVVVAFTLPAGSTFHPDPESGFNMGAGLSATQALRTSYDIPARNITRYMAYDRAQIGRPYELFPNRDPLRDPAFFEPPN
jgi:hypothetical protein